MCYLLEVFKVICEVVGNIMVVGVRLLVIDWVEGGWDCEQFIKFSQQLEMLGSDYIYVFSGGLLLQQVIIVGLGYQLFFVCDICQQVVILVIGVGLIIDLQQVEVVLENGDVDLIVFVCVVFYDLYWLWYVVVSFGVQVCVLLQYLCLELYGLKGILLLNC